MTFLQSRESRTCQKSLEKLRDELTRSVAARFLITFHSGKYYTIDFANLNYVLQFNIYNNAIIFNITVEKL